MNLIDRTPRIFSRLLKAFPVRQRGVLVSVIIPVYNTENYLRQMLDSLIDQDLPADNFEVIAVDDGSTDSSGSILEEYANRIPHLHVVHQENSGWAGKPRNVALGLSQGKYVFFADADDILAPDALRRMVDFARQYRLDVVLPKVVGIGGRKQTSSLYARTNPSATPLQALKSLTPQKLVKRSLIEENHLRFAEEPVRLEDGMFMVACYLKAKRIGILADEAFYSLRQRADGSNISYRPLVPHEYTASIAKIAAIVKDMAKSRAQAEAMTLSLWTRKGLKIYEPRRFPRYSQTIQEHWLEAHAGFLEEFIPLELSRRLGDVHHRKTEAIRRKDRQAVLETNEIEAKLTRPVTVTEAKMVNGSFVFSGRVESKDLNCVRISAEPREKNSAIVLQTVLTAADGHFSGIISALPRGFGVWDFYAELSLEGIAGPNRRLAVDEGSFLSDGGFSPYQTQNGYLSLRSSSQSGKPPAV